MLLSSMLTKSQVISKSQKSMNKNMMRRGIGLIGFLLMFQITHAQFRTPKILKHPKRILVKSMYHLNSPYRETNICISPDGKYMFFMTGRGGQPWSGRPSRRWKGKLEYSGDIWYAQKIGKKWSIPRALPATVNTDNGEDEPNVSPDGQTVYFQSWYGNWEKRGGPYYSASLYGSHWSRPRGLGGGINAFFQNRQDLGEELATDGATMSADGKTFIVAVGPYDGNMNLYMSRKDRFGRWSFLKRLSVSTMGNERSPAISADGKTLYFASSGYGGYGGLDIFKTTIHPDGSHGKIVNLGAPFNTVYDDYGLALTAQGDEAYFIREGDIYFADTRDANPEMKPNTSTLMVTGVVTNQKTKKPMGTTVTFLHAQTGQVITRVTSNSVTGQYATMIPLKDYNFIQAVRKTGFNDYNKGFSVQIKTGLNKVIANIKLKPVKKEEETIIAKKDPIKIKRRVAKNVIKECAAETGRDH